MLVMGIGNILMKDDGIGVYLVQEFMAENEIEGIRYIAGETDVDYCLAEAEGSEYLIILDAVQFGGEKGCVYEIQLSDLREMEKGIAGHNFHLFHALSNKQGILVGVEPFEVEFHFGLSKRLKEKMPEIKEKIRTLIHGKAAEYTNGHG